jgi:hypothetical protein
LNNFIAEWLSVERYRKGFHAGFDQTVFSIVFYRNIRLLPDGQSFSLASDNDSPIKTIGSGLHF